MGFSIPGLIVAAIIFAPNLLMLLFPPKEVPAGLKDAGIFYTVLERVGQIGCIVLLCLAVDFSIFPVTVWVILLIACIAMYWGLWLRYVLRGQAFSLLFRPLGFLPIPMAVFPVLAFTFAAVAGRSLWMGIAAVLLGIGHLKNSWHTYRQIADSRK